MTRVRKLVFLVIAVVLGVAWLLTWVFALPHKLVERLIACVDF